MRKLWFVFSLLLWSALPASGQVTPNGVGEGARAVAASGDGQLVLVGAGQDLYRSTDGGVTWNRVAVLPEVYAPAGGPVNPSIAYALDGGPLLQSTDGGATWQGIGSPPNTSPGPPGLSA
jgi:photosystem II stability/assembly factor-like uncharacterized protein